MGGLNDLYKDHTEILGRIPNCFYEQLIDELVGVFGKDILDCAKEYGDLCSGTYGWHKAMGLAAEKLGLSWIMEYSDSIEWYDSDVFDGLIEERCCNLVKQR